eukprot:jgi/Mesen1/9199/ME000591S08530
MPPGAHTSVQGVVALAKSLRRYSQHQLIVVVTPEVPAGHCKILKSHGCVLRQVQPILPPKRKGERPFLMQHYALNYTKLRIWELDEYDRLIYLDSDMLALGSLDFLFSAVPDNKLGAALDCFCAGDAHPDYRRKGGRYCQVAPDTKPWPGPGPAPPLYFNAGLLVLHPSKGVFEEMMERLETYTQTTLAEQDFLNAFFDGDFVVVPHKYNLLLHLLWLHPEKVGLDEAVNIHFCVLGSKPWAFDPTAEHMHHKEVHALQNCWERVYHSENAGAGNAGAVACFHPGQPASQCTSQALTAG